MNYKNEEKYKSDCWGKIFVLAMSVLLLLAIVCERKSSVFGLALGLFVFGSMDLFKFLRDGQKRKSGDA